MRWRTNFNYHGCFTAMSEQQAILVRKPWLKHNFQAHSKSHLKWNPWYMLSRVVSTSKVSESPHQKQMTCSSVQQNTQDPSVGNAHKMPTTFQATLVYDIRLYLVMRNLFLFFYESFWFTKHGREVIIRTSEAAKLLIHTSRFQLFCH